MTFNASVALKNPTQDDAGYAMLSLINTLLRKYIRKEHLENLVK